MISRVVLCGRQGLLTGLVARRLGEAGLEVERVEAAAELGGLLEGRDAGTALVYLAATFDRHGLAPDLDSAGKIFDVCAKNRIAHVVVISSAAVNEPSAHYLGLLDETRQATRWTGNTLPDRWLELETRARAALAGQPLTLLRPAIVLVSRGRDFWSRYFSRRFAFTPFGFDPSLQLLAAEDLAASIAALLPEIPAATLPRTRHLAPAGTIPLRQALRRARIVRLPLPHAAHWLARKLLSPLGLAAPAEIIDYLRYPFTIAGKADATPDSLLQRGVSSGAAIRSLRGLPREDKKDEAFDPFGLDPAYIARLGRTLFRFLHDVWWRVEHRGLDRIPRQGGAVLAGVHRGFQPWDGVMAMHLIAKNLGRHVRFMVHPSLFKPPCLTPFMARLGGVPACGENADWVLERGQILAIYPEGIRGAFRLYGRDVYHLGKFGRDEFVRFALRHQVPIVPFVTLGSAEIFPILGKIRWSWWKRQTEWPFLPITPTLGLLPLPSKWHTRFLEPVEIAGIHPPEAAGDPAIVRGISHAVRRRMSKALEDLERRRRHIFWGNLAEPEGL